MNQPDGLAERGARFWSTITEAFELSDPEHELLAEACRTLDDLDRLAESVATVGAMVTGAAGQPVVNPALTESRGQRLALHRLLSALDLPEDAAVPDAVTLRNRQANRTRWARQKAV